MEEKKEGFSPPVRHLRLPHHHPVGRRLLYRARRGPPALARGAGAVQGLYQPAEVERLSLDPHHRLGPRRQAGRGADPHRTRCTRSPRPASPRTGPTGTASGSRTRSPSIPSSWLRSMTERLRRGRGRRGFPRAREARDVHRPGVLLHAEGRGGEAAARRDADRLRLCDPHPDRRQLRRRQGRRPAGAAVDQAAQRPVGRRSSAPRASGRSRRGRTWWSPAAPRRRSGAACAASSARRRCGSGARSPASRWSGSARRRPTRRCEAAARRLGLEDAEDVLARLGAAEMTGKELVATLYPELLREAALPTSVRQDGAGRDRPRHRPGGAARALLQPDPGRADRRHRRARQGRDDPRHRLRRARRLRGRSPTAGSTCAGPRGSRRRPYGRGSRSTLANDAGVLGRICTLIGEQRANITDIVFTDRKPDFYRMVIDIEVRDMEHLHPCADRDRRRFGRGAGAALPPDSGGGRAAGRG